MSYKNVKVENNANAFKSEMDNRIGEVLVALGIKATSIWQKIITEKKVVDTGRFRNSVQWSVNKPGKKVIIGSGVKYSQFLELGTYKMKARPTLKPALLDYKEEYKSLIEEMLKRD